MQAIKYLVDPIDTSSISIDMLIAELLGRLPHDAELVSQSKDSASGQAYLVFMSSEFEDVQGGEIPIYDPKKHDRKEPEPVADLGCTMLQVSQSRSPQALF